MNYLFNALLFDNFKPAFNFFDELIDDLYHYRILFHKPVQAFYLCFHDNEHRLHRSELFRCLVELIDSFLIQFKFKARESTDLIYISFVPSPLWLIFFACDTLFLFILLFRFAKTLADLIFLKNISLCWRFGLDLYTRKFSVTFKWDRFKFDFFPFLILHLIYIIYRVQTTIC